MAEPAMKTLANVPIVSTGTYELGGNLDEVTETTTFTLEDLEDMVAASKDPTLHIPRVKLGHTTEWGDGEPAFGHFDDLRLVDGTIYADMVGVPSWLADILPQVYPSRSIEGSVGVKSQNGSEYRMWIHHVALLGVIVPGVTSLQDLAALYSEEMPEGVVVDVEDEIEARIGGDMKIGRRREVAASTALEDVRRAFYEKVAVGDQTYWWVREIYLDPIELIVDDGDGCLYRMTVEIGEGEGDGSYDDISFGEPEEVKVQYVAAETSRGGMSRPMPVEAGSLVFASRSESRPETTGQEDQMDQMDPKKVRSLLGLPENASDEAVEEKLKAAGEETPPSTQPPGESGGAPAEEGPETATPSEPGEEQQPAPEEPAPPEQPQGEPTQPQPVAAAGVAQVDAKTLDTLKRTAARVEEQDEAEDKRVIEDAIKAGKFGPASRGHYTTLMAQDREGTRKTIGALESDVIPVTARGSVPENEDETVEAYPEQWVPEVAARRRAAEANGSAIAREEG